MLMERNVGKRAEMRRVLEEDTLPSWLKRLERKMVSHGKEYATSDELTIADLSLFVVADWLTCGIPALVPMTVLENYPKVASVLRKVRAHPKVAEWCKRQ